jgi:hypothetical protein
LIGVWYSDQRRRSAWVRSALRIERPGRREGGVADEEAPLLCDGHRPALAGSFYFMSRFLKKGDDAAKLPASITKRRRLTGFLALA